MPSLEDFLEYRRKLNNFGHFIGVEILEMKLGSAVCKLPLKNELMNPNRTIHGGVIFSLADMTAGTAAASYGMKCTTVDSHISFLAPAMDSKELYCEAYEVKHGKTISVFETRVKDETEKLISVATFTFYNLSIPLIQE